MFFIIVVIAVGWEERQSGKHSVSVAALCWCMIVFHDELGKTTFLVAEGIMVALSLIGTRIEVEE